VREPRVAVGELLEVVVREQRRLRGGARYLVRVRVRVGVGIRVRVRFRVRVRVRVRVRWRRVRSPPRAS